MTELVKIHWVMICFIPYHNHEINFSGLAFKVKKSHPFLIKYSKHVPARFKGLNIYPSDGTIPNTELPIL